jgi:hypothetical protein
MSTAVNTFDVSKYIPSSVDRQEPTGIICFTPTSIRDDYFSYGSAGLPHPEEVAVLPLWIDHYVWQKLPRNIPWTEFPIVADPFHVLVEPSSGLDPSHGVITLPTKHAHAILREQPYLLYDEQGFTEIINERERIEARFKLHQLKALLKLDIPTYTRLDGESKFLLCDDGAMAEASAGWQRYKYSYRINFRAIAFKALDHILSRFPPPEFPVEPEGQPQRNRKFQSWQKAYLRDQRTHLDEPCSLQVLYAIRHASLKENEDLYATFESAYRNFEDLDTFSFGRAIRHGNWIGSGKFDAKFPILNEFNRAIFSAQALGLAEREGSGRFKLTDAGEAFLDCMHTDNDDPDAFLRFVDPITGTMPRSESERIDAWMMRFFRKMKTKMNAL